MKMPPINSVLTTIRVDPPDAEIVVIRVEPVTDGWRKFPVPVGRIGDGLFQASLLSDFDHFLLVRSPGFSAQLQQFTPGPAASNLTIGLSPLQQGTQQDIRQDSKAQLVLSPLVFAGDPLGPERQEEIRRQVKEVIEGYLSNEVDNCELLAQDDPSMVKFNSIRHYLLAQQIKRTPGQIIANLEALIAAPHAQIEVCCRKRGSKIRLEVAVRRIFGLHQFAAIPPNDQSASVEPVASPPIAGPPPRYDPGNEATAYEKVAYAPQLRVKHKARELAQLIALRLHTFYPSLVFPPEYPYDYDSFYLRIGERQVDGYPVWRETEPGNKASLLGHLPSAELPGLKVVADQITYSQDSEDLSPLLQKFGEQLYQWLTIAMGDELEKAWQHAQVRRPRHGLRLRLGCDDSEIRKLPWEYLFVPFLKSDGHIARQTDFVFSRYLPVPSSGTACLPVSKIGSLVVTASPPADTEFAPFDFRVEQDVVRWGVNRAYNQPHGDEWRDIDLAFLPFESRQATWQEITELLTGTVLPLAPHIFHFIGHGQVEENESRLIGLQQVEVGELVIQPLGSNEIRTLLQPGRSLRLIILQSCRGATADAQVDLGFTLASIFPAVIAMQHIISIGAARYFAHHFYRGLALGHNVDVAAAEGRQRIAQQYTKRRSWGTPLLYAQEVQLFPAQVEASSTNLPRGGHNGNPQI